jgi:hypothetical protein
VRRETFIVASTPERLAHDLIVRARAALGLQGAHEQRVVRRCQRLDRGLPAHALRDEGSEELLCGRVCMRGNGGGKHFGRFGGTEAMAERGLDLGRQLGRERPLGVELRELALSGCLLVERRLGAVALRLEVAELLGDGVRNEAADALGISGVELVDVVVSGRLEVGVLLVGRIVERLGRLGVVVGR